ncbi:hypothetical protein B0H66DRAFT_598478 [Apodospora peruviana]|uniref:Myosin class II heavy chain n=1 Tax=Apodospora peruviana TaxID=516989 RepID=A0AAE0ITS1_9PEZI|nr:hypothetical protein B0H66DRAFT_598478 [Apodospora peruviana]
MRLFEGLLKTSSSTSSPQTPPRASAQDGPRSSRARRQSAASSDLSSASTADGEASPELPPLPAPKLPDRVLGLLRTPPIDTTEEEDSQLDANHWGSPYPRHLRSESLSSDTSEESPIHQLQLRTPFLRSAPSVQESSSDTRPPAISAAAAVLANRARRVAHGITEDWIRQHTAGGSDLEKRHWFSDGTGDSENSSLSGSFSGDDAAWLGDHDSRTPRASRQRSQPRQTPPRGHPRKKSSSETLRQAHLNGQKQVSTVKMASSDERATPDISHDGATPALERPSTPKLSGDAAAKGSPKGSIREPNAPSTPSRGIKWAPNVNTTPRFRKKVPWKGKNIMVHLPKDAERGQPGQAPKPLTEADVNGMLRSWEQLGYNVGGFDLDTPSGFCAPGEYSQSRGAWPDFDEVIRERKAGSWRVLLPDLNAWRKYVDELNEAKLRALGVSFGEEEAPAPSISPASTMSRQASVTQYPPLPFSPPLPTSSASSSHGMAGFPFPGQFVTSATQSPGIPAGASPTSFGNKYNPRASISIPSPHGWSPQMMMHPGHRVGSPSLANLNAMRSPTSPFSVDGMSSPALLHQRHQSLQFPVLPHQFQQQARASPRLQDLREVEEEPPSKSPSKTPEPEFVPQHNASDSLQKEIEEAEYHLEEQMRSQLENDEDYSPHNDNDNAQAPPVSSNLTHAREPSVQFAPHHSRFGGDADDLVLHHPRPHSRGHSLSQKYFTEEDVSHDRAFKPTLQGISPPAADESEVETNPSNLGTPIQGFDFAKLMHQRSFSTASNPWTDNESGKSASGSIPRRTSHGSKPSLSKLNVEAPEFKFNPGNTFKPGQFNFSSSSFQPSVFNAGMTSANSSQFSLPTTISSKINVNAPAFSPGQSDFSFSTSGPKFNPVAPAFTPHSLSNSITSPVSGGESSSKRGSSIFGNIDLSNSEIILPAKKSKAVPIVRPDIQSPRPDGIREGADGRMVDDSRIKRARGNAADDDAVPLFAQPTEEATPVPESGPEKPTEEEDVPLEEKSFDESQLGPADTTMSSIIVSETTDTKATSSPSETSPDPATMAWTPFEFKNPVELQNFAEARPFGDDISKQGHKKSLSATAKAFVPGVPVSETTGFEPEEKGDDLADETDELLEQFTTIDEPTQGTSTGESQVEKETAEVTESIESSDPVQIQLSKSPTVEVPQLPRISSQTAPGSGLSSSRYASPPPPPKRTGLAASRFAASPSPVPDDEVREASQIVSSLDADQVQQSLPLPAEKSSLTSDAKHVAEVEHVDSLDPAEPSMADIDAIMRHLNENPGMGVNRNVDSQPEWHQPSPTRVISLAAVTDSSPLRLPPQSQFRSDAPSPSPRQYRTIPDMSQPILSTELDDPFVDPPHSPQSSEGPIHRLNGSESLPASDWDGVFSQDEQTKLESRVNFFDGHVNELVGGLLTVRLGPLEETLDTIKRALADASRRPPSSWRERRSMSAEIRDSDADDEDDEMPLPRRSMSPRRDRRMEQIRSAVLDAFAAQQRTQPKETSPAPALKPADNSQILQALEDMKEQFSQSLHLDFRGEDLKNIVEEAVERRMPPTPKPVIIEENNNKVNELKARVLELEQRMLLEQTKAEQEATARRAAEDRAAELNRELQSAATKIEVEMMNKSALNQRINDLEERAHHSELQSEEEVKGRRAAEDRLAEVQRLLRISSEEEVRLREVVDERDQKIKAIESRHSKNAMRLALLESNQSNSQQTQSEGQNRINVLETDLRDARQQARHFESETDRLSDIARRRDAELTDALGENKALHKLIDTLGTQLQENERVREIWRSKFVLLQGEMAKATREITEENARRTKKEQAMLARQEVLDARLQAEARTRERIETELERLEMGERQGMRAVAECKRLEILLGELRKENSELQQSALRYQAEFQEARESGAREVQRTREAMQAEVEAANHKVNVVRSELDDDLSNLRAQLDQVRMDYDTANAQHEMLLEEAENSKQAELDEAMRKHQNELEDLQARYERQLSNTTEDAQRAEQNLLERLSISTSKSEYLQDKVAHLEEKLEIAKEAALAAAQAAKSSVASPELSIQPKTVSSRHMELPEKISPQALRESIMVLQEQLQEREHRIEELEQALSKTDPDAESKISKRDDEIIWLRELLAVRHSDLQDIIAALGREDYDKHAVKDAAIRLKANLQMEEQERERAMNGGSAINLPNIAATIRDAATPRVAQAVGPLAAAWGNWRKGRDPNSFGSLGNVLSSPSASNTPSKSSPAQGSFLGGLLTPPASGIRQTPPAPAGAQPTAFSSTGRRFTAQDLANRPRASVSRQEGKMPLRDSPPLQGPPGPMTPPMMRPSAYDLDAQAEDFDDAGFFDD